MKVKDLIEILEKVDQNRIVILSKDSEGNTFSPLDFIQSNANYAEEDSCFGEVGFEELTEELKEFYTEEDVIEGKPALILWPVQ